VKRMIACVSLVAAATTAAVSAPSPPPQHAQHTQHTQHVAARAAKAKPRAKCRIAPADEYFGRLKMSILGIRNVIKDQGLKIDVAPENGPSSFATMALTEDALHDWQHKYPCDSWLPGTIYALEHFYAKIHTSAGVQRVHAVFAWLRHDFPRANITGLARKEDGEATTTPGGTPPDPPGGGSDPGASAAIVPAATSPPAAHPQR
jgi:hypothetical protein